MLLMFWPLVVDGFNLSPPLSSLRGFGPPAKLQNPLRLVRRNGQDFVDEVLRRPWRRRWAAVGLALSLVFLNPLHVTPPGSVTVVSRLGHVSTCDPGISLVTPLVSTKKLFSTQTRLLEQENFVPTREGLTVELDTAILYRLEPSEIGRIYTTVGEEFERVLVEPELASAVRALTSEAEASALYTSGRNLIQMRLQDELQAALQVRGIQIEQVLLKAVKLPEQVTASIELKAKAEQEAARMQFVLDKERQEAERKAIEARGIAEFQKIVSDGISPRLLRWKGIEATEKLAESSNTKIIIIGSSKDGLPVILGGGSDSK